ncbi:hypothetical protein [Longimicrobium sp.]|uniref:hypothetical protein n=1 Tax=Longimicrobium sp. TaxID=2029185 RepID=UPI003B3A5FED
MKVQPTGIIFVAECDIQSDRCTARTSSPITAVWTTPGREQVNVCRACLEEMVRAGEWEITGARVSPRADLALVSPGGSPLLIVEIKRRPGVIRDPRAWAARIHRNLLLHGALQPTSHFLLAAVPGPFYLWLARDFINPGTPADAEIQPDARTAERLASLLESDARPVHFEHVVADWLTESVQHLSEHDWLNEIGRDAELDRAVVQTEYAM